MSFKKLPIVAYLLLMPILLSLGNWQLNRANEKQQFINIQAEQANGEVVELMGSSLDDAKQMRYKKVWLSGHYDPNRQFLLDNQIDSGKVGYLVLTPFILDGGEKAVLVNRGWLASMPKRSELPNVAFTETHTTLTGRINQFPSVGITLPEATIPTQAWPSVVQVVDTSILSKKLGYDLFSFQVELDGHLPNGYKREWHNSTVMLPEQHTAYAMQWFGLALTLTVLFIVYSVKIYND